MEEWENTHRGYIWKLKYPTFLSKYISLNNSSVKSLSARDSTSSENSEAKGINFEGVVMTVNHDDCLMR